MRTPLLLLDGVQPTALDAALLALACDLPSAVSVRHRIDPAEQRLTRVVADVTGVVETEHLPLEHVCVSCTVREDLLDTCERLAAAGRWTGILVGLPTATDATGIARVLTRDPRRARRLRLAGVGCAVEGEHLDRHLLGQDLLAEHGWHASPADERGVGEVAAAQLEHADLAIVVGEPGRVALDLVHALLRPGASAYAGTAEVDAQALLAGRHSPGQAAAWTDVTEIGALPPLACDSLAWRLDLCADRPFHPGRLLERIEDLGSGAHRSRGAFWVPTRPGSRLQWSGAGGQLSIGDDRDWGRRTPLTRLVLTGLGTAPGHLLPAFEDLLVTPREARRGSASWQVAEDGLEPWLGDIRDIA